MRPAKREQPAASGNHTFAVAPSFSNTDGSGYTSLGRYRIGTPYNGHFGRSYKLYGLDSTNSQAFRRNIVLHSFSYVPETCRRQRPIRILFATALAARWSRRVFFSSSNH